MGKRKPFTTSLDPDLLFEFKLQCVQDKQDMNKVLEELIKKYLAEKKKD